jgi:hypothetical protein
VEAGEAGMPAEIGEGMKRMEAPRAAAAPPGPPRSRPTAAHWAWGGAAGVAVLLAVLWSTAGLMGGGWRPDAERVEGPPEPQPPLAAPGTRVARLEDWLRTDGRWIFYRYGTYMPGACDQRTRAVGNWGADGWSAGTRVVCIDQAWLALDVERLGRRFRLSPETTYCVNFVYVIGNTSHWGQHGSLAAPGLDSIRVVAPNGSYNIGFAIVREDGRRRVRLTNAYPGPRC